MIDPQINEGQDIPAMNTLAERVNKAVKDGYAENFQVSKQGLHSAATDRIYKPSETMIVNYFRFEGLSDPADNAILYIIETNDGVRGTLIDAYGAYTDENINNFITEVHSIEKK